VAVFVGELAGPFDAFAIRQEAVDIEVVAIHFAAGVSGPCHPNFDGLIAELSPQRSEPSVCNAPEQREEPAGADG